MRFRRFIPFFLAAAATSLSACSVPADGGGEGSPSPAPPGVSPAPPPASAPALPPAPWAGAPLPQDRVAPHFLSEWRRAANREVCAPIAPAALGEGAGAVPRAATFSGGWAVAFDRAGVRSAFGVAGTGTSSAPDPAEYRWPQRRSWADGSSAGYGPEGGTGPSELAYLRIAGQGCLYNVWSRLGREHLEFLLEQLRFVDTMGS